MIVLAGCSTQTRVATSGHVVELDDVPFFAQKRYHCGPAALATLLVDSGVSVTPDELAAAVYVPARKGSFQPELKAAARSYDRLPFILEPDLESLFAEIDAGNPVLVLQNLWFSWLPKWHYAVVVGYDSHAKTVILRSGTTERRVEKLNDFVRTWGGGDNWALVALRPNQIPATATAERYFATIAESEGRVSAAAMTRGLEAALHKWPTNANIVFAAANHTRMQGNPEQAAALYRQSLALNPQHLGALNNYSDLLYSEACFAAAAQEIGKAQQLVEADSVLYVTINATANEIAAAGNYEDNADCGILIGTE